MQNLGDGDIFETSYSYQDRMWQQIIRIYRKKIDRYIIYVRERWIFTALIYMIFYYRIFVQGGFWVVQYILGLFLLHLSIQFFTPLGLPDIEDDDDQIFGDLPTTNQDDNSPCDNIQKPMIRNISEFKYWQNFTISGIICIFMTFSRFFDLPVFWPFLLIYFILLVGATIRKLYQHKQKYGYNFFESGKMNDQ